MSEKQRRRLASQSEYPAAKELEGLMDMKRGAQWRRWDLHVHTPCSIKQNFGGDTPDAWQKYLLDLEKLPTDTVIGVNDYIFLDGYKKLREFKQAGRLTNIARLLPVVELRLDRFGGTDGKLSRVNLHVIFSDAIDIETVESQFINALSTTYTLTPEYAGSVEWSGVPTRKSLTDLGEKVKSVLPAESPLHNEDSLSLGFANLNISIKEVKKILGGAYFKGKCLTAIGKTEWYDIKWSEASIAEKKSIINSVDMIFTAANTVDDWRKSKKQLEKNGVPAARLLDCSDAHTFSHAASQDTLKLRPSLTWIKSDPTFEGLRHAVCEEYETRVFVGDCPEKIVSVQSNPTKYIDSIEINKISNSKISEDWFHGTQIPLNSGLTAIIGNKGSGKSALADILGLVGNCYLDKKHFSFLNKARFLHPHQNKGANFEAKVSWESKETFSINLSGEIDKNKTEAIKYIPQSYLEELCNDSPERLESSRLEVELKEVIFSHIPKEERLGCDSLDSLIEEHTKGNRNEIEGLRSSLIGVNREICALEDVTKDSYKVKTVNDLASKQFELKQHDILKPEEIAAPGTSTSDPNQEKIVSRLSKWQSFLDKIELKISAASQALAKLQTKQVLAKNTTVTLTQAFDRFNEQTSAVSGDLEKLGIPISEVLSASLDTSALRKLQSDLATDISTQLIILNPFTGKTHARRERVKSKILALRERLAGPSKDYQNYLVSLKIWETAREEIVGDLEKSGSLSFLEGRIAQIQEAPNKLIKLRGDRSQIALAITSRILGLLELYRKLYKPVQDFIERKVLKNDQYQLSFEARINCEGFQDRFLHFINHSKTGSFYGVEEARKRVTDLVELADFQVSSGVEAFLNSIIENMESNFRDTPPSPNEVDTQLAKGVKRIELYNFIFSADYLAPRYSLKMGSRAIEQLSPGEKGLLLLAFYLLLDKDCRPLLIDQPEENLDNQTVHQLLVPCVKEARNRRQVILVTHNPNLAVVCDADQVIVASMQKTAPFKVSYDSGAIENPEINSKIVDILEGTMPAFRNRDFKYFK